MSRFFLWFPKFSSLISSSLKTYSKCTIYNCYHSHPQVADFLCFLYHYYYYFTPLYVFFHANVSWLFFPCNLSDNKSFQVSRTLLSILVDPNAIVWMVSIPLIFKFSSPFIKPFGIVSSAAVIIVSWSPSWSIVAFFLVFLQGLGTYFFFRFLLILRWNPPVQQSPLFDRFSFFVDYFYHFYYYNFWISRRNNVRSSWLNSIKPFIELREFTLL